MGGGLISSRILSWLLVAVVTLGIESRGAAKKGGWIGRGDVDDVERLSIGVSGDCTPALEQVIGLDGADGVNKVGVLFSWWEEGSIVGNDVSCLVDSGVEGDSVELLFIVIDAGNEVWQWWVKVGGRNGHAEEASS